MRTLMLLNRNISCKLLQRGCASKASGTTKPPATPKTSPTPAARAATPTSSGAPSIQWSNVTGLSVKVVGTQEPVGPGAARNAEYKVPEYFNFNNFSYHEAEVELAKYRCPQPDAHRK